MQLETSGMYPRSQALPKGLFILQATEAEQRLGNQAMRDVSSLPILFAARTTKERDY